MDLSPGVFSSRFLLRIGTSDVSTDALFCPGLKYSNIQTLEAQHAVGIVQELAWNPSVGVSDLLHMSGNAPDVSRDAPSFFDL